MQTTTLTTDNLAAIVAWLEGKDDSKPACTEPFISELHSRIRERKLQTESVAKRLSLTSLLEDTIIETTTIQNEKNETHELQMEQMEQMARRTTAEPRMEGENLPLQNDQGYIEAGYDSVDIARAIVWHYGQLDREVAKKANMTMTLLQYTLYCVYGVVLAQRKTRLYKEHPKMWQYGPMFPRVYNKMRGDMTGSAEEADKIRKADPSLGEFIPRMLRINACMRHTDLTKLHTSATSPWGRCRAEHGEDWTADIDDRQLEQWFTKYIEKSK